MADVQKKTGITLKTLLTIFLPLITTIASINYQYVITRLEGSDQNYRATVSKLADSDSTLRHAAAASIGTYLVPDGRYLDETIDILTVRLSSEPNYNVRNSIIGSLKKIKHQDSKYKQIIDRLLTISRNNFIQDYHMKKELDNVRLDYSEVLEDLRDAETKYKNTTLSSDQLDLRMLKSEVTYKLEEITKLQREYDELQFSKPIVSDMISIFLSEKKNTHIAKLDFFRTTMSSVVLTDLILKEPSIKWATFYNSNLTDSTLDSAFISQTDFSSSLLVKANFIENNIDTTLFVKADLTDTNFSNSSFSDVFFIEADLYGASFAGAKGLKPVYFYGSKNFDQATFDNPDFVDRILELKIADFEIAVNSSRISNADKKYLFKTVDNLAQ